MRVILKIELLEGLIIRVDRKAKKEIIVGAVLNSLVNVCILVVLKSRIYILVEVLQNILLWNDNEIGYQNVTSEIIVSII